LSLGLFIGTSVTILGLVMGSAVTALAWRVPRGESWVHGRSRCPKCGHVLGVRDLFPVLSWLVHRGRCRHCGAPVSPRYPVTELACGAWALLAWLKLGLVPAYPLVAAWGFLLVALFWIDLDFKLLPHVLTVPGTLVGLGAALLAPGARLDPAGWVVGSLLHLAPGSLPSTLVGIALGVLAGAGVLWLVREAWFVVRKVEGMGFGDVMLGLMFGVLLGAWGSLLTIFLGAFAGASLSVVLMARGRAHMKSELPFGVFLAPAAMVAFLWSDPMLHWYLRLFR
jgi:leader peptidase (prepilin peptidase)/N-methyltransferase